MKLLTYVICIALSMCSGLLAMNALKNKQDKIAVEQFEMAQQEQEDAERSSGDIRNKTNQEILKEVNKKYAMWEKMFDTWRDMVTAIKTLIELVPTNTLYSDYSPADIKKLQQEIARRALALERPKILSNTDNEVIAILEKYRLAGTGDAGASTSMGGTDTSTNKGDASASTSDAETKFIEKEVKKQFDTWKSETTYKNLKTASDKWKYLVQKALSTIETSYKKNKLWGTQYALQALALDQTGVDIESVDLAPLLNSIRGYLPNNWKD